ncbi:hypothetical protein TrRE_jg6799 [Triparma retinervis]|uniref:Uncharacterized protein n=1 Tax=Triparma retinervis TaxID=2557542 RepID=A0A9W7CDM8_9STRA|nr:hypothetical protein TrRE_jg6799 [Triparma retinervis]
MVGKKTVGWTAGEEAKGGRGEGLDGQYPLRSCVWKLHVPERTECVVAVHNKDVRLQRGRVVEGDYPPVGVSILKAPEKGMGGGVGGLGMTGRGRGGYQYVGGQGVRKERQVMTERIELEEGVYLIVPYTTMEYEDGLAGGGDGGMEEVAGSVRAACGEVFDRFDEKNLGVLGGGEFGKLIDTIVGLERLNDTVKRGKISDGLGWIDGIGLLEKDRWIKKMESMVRRAKEGGGMRALSECLMACGYEMDRGGCWRLVNASVGALSVHTSVECKLTEAGKNSMALRDAVELVVMGGEEEFAIEHGFKTFVAVHGSNGVSLGVQNMRRGDAYVMMDCGGSEGAESHRGGMKCEERLKAGEFKVMHTLVPERSDEEWTWKFDVAITDARGGEGGGS